MVKSPSFSRWISSSTAVIICCPMVIRLALCDSRGREQQPQRKKYGNNELRVNIEISSCPTSRVYCDVVGLHALEIELSDLSSGLAFVALYFSDYAL